MDSSVLGWVVVAFQRIVNIPLATVLLGFHLFKVHSWKMLKTWVTPFGINRHKYQRWKISDIRLISPCFDIYLGNSLFCRYYSRRSNSIQTQVRIILLVFIHLSWILAFAAALDLSIPWQLCGECSVRDLIERHDKWENGLHTSKQRLIIHDNVIHVGSPLQTCHIYSLPSTTSQILLQVPNELITWVGEYFHFNQQLNALFRVNHLVYLYLGRGGI